MNIKIHILTLIKLYIPWGLPTYIQDTNFTLWLICGLKKISQSKCDYILVDTEEVTHSGV